MTDFNAYLEAERRGILPADKQTLLDEARSRGLVPPLSREDRFRALAQKEARESQRYLRRIDDAVRSVASGITGFYADELAAAANTATGLGAGSYKENLKAEVARDEAIPPEIAIPGQIAGGVISGGAGAARLLGTQALKNAPKLLTVPAIGTAEGAIAGSGLNNEDRLQGAAEGAALGFAGSLAAPLMVSAGSAAVRAFRRLSPREKALRLVEKAMQSDAVTVPRMERRLQQLGDEAMLVDAAGENLRGVGRAAAGQPGASRVRAERALENRVQTQGQRVTRAVGDSLSDEAFNATEQALIASRRANARPLYEEALSAGVVDDPRIAKLLEKSADLRNAIKHARRLPEYTDLPDNHIALLDKAYKRIGDAANNARIRGKGELSRDLNNLRADFKELLIENVPVYGRALDSFSDDSAMLDALRLGRNFLREDAGITAEYLARLPSSEREMFRVGASQAIRNNIEGAADASDVTRRVFGNKSAREKLKAVFPDTDTYRRFQQQMAAEAQFAKTRNFVLRGSPTQPRQADIMGLATDVAEGNAPGLLRRVVGGVTGERKLSPKVNEELAGILFSRNPAANQTTVAQLEDRILAAAIARQRQQGVAQGLLGGSVTGGAGLLSQ